MPINHPPLIRPGERSKPVDLQKLFIEARDDYRAAKKAAKLRQQLKEQENAKT